MSDIRLEVVVSQRDGETLSDSAERAKRLLRGMDQTAFQTVSVRRWRGE